MILYQRLILRKPSNPKQDKCPTPLPKFLSLSGTSLRKGGTAMSKYSRKQKKMQVGNGATQRQRRVVLFFGASS